MNQIDLFSYLQQEKKAGVGGESVLEDVNKEWWLMGKNMYFGIRHLSFNIHFQKSQYILPIINSTGLVLIHSIWGWGEL